MKYCFTPYFLSIAVFAFLFLPNRINCQTSDTIQTHFTPLQCDSLIEANKDNPDFVILDVRTPTEYVPEHIEGAINRDYYNAEFTNYFDTLPKHKFYLIHCASGGRSFNAFNIVTAKDFPKIVNMIGGIRAWKKDSLPVTSEFAPLLKAVSDTIIVRDSMLVGTMDTFSFTVTNRANDRLRFLDIDASNSSLYIEFDTSVILRGAEDYTFDVIFQADSPGPVDATIVLESTGGIQHFYFRTVVYEIISATRETVSDELLPFPNPVSGILTIPQMDNSNLQIFNQFGVLQHRWSYLNQNTIDVSHLKNGIHYLIFEQKQSREMLKFVKI